MVNILILSAYSTLHINGKKSGKRQEVYALHSNAHTERSQANHRQKAVSEHGGRSISIDPTFRHEIQKCVDGGDTKKRDTIDIAELRLAGLCSPGRRW